MPNSELNFQKEFEYNDNSKYLCVLIHGYGSSELLKKRFPQTWNIKNMLNDLKEIVEKVDFSGSEEKKDIGNVDIYFPDITTQTSIFSKHHPNDIVQKILEDIDKIWNKKKYQKIYIIGYSMGALLARKVYVCACGNNKEAPLEEELIYWHFNKIPIKFWLFLLNMDCIAGILFLGRFLRESFNKPTEWADKVDRIILLAGMNRGWSINHHLSLWKSIVWTLGVVLGNLMMLFGKKPLIFHIRKGSSFLTRLRIQWIYMKREANKKKVDQALTIQLLGTIDDLVSPEDNIDLVSGKNFIYLDVPFSNHSSVVEMEMPPRDKNEKTTLNINQKRGEVFVSALTKTEKVLGKDIPAAIIDIESTAITHRFQEKDPDKITDVIFVIHGIRDEGHWTNRIANKVIEENRKVNEHRSNDKKRHFAIETSRYGYFPMLLFVLPWTRRAKVAWFMDQYAENLARYKEAKFSFIGHSNGTYLLAQAIKEYECCKFKRVVFAGSVVSKDYPWSDYISEKKVDKVLNYVATFDWVVAIFPNLLHWFQKDLGSAGHDGFYESQVTNIKYIKGRHGAALSQYNWDAIAKFIVADSPDLPDIKSLQPPEIYQDENESRKKCIETIGKFPWIAWIIIFLIILGPGSLIFLFSGHWWQWLRTIVFLLYLWGIWKILTII